MLVNLLSQRQEIEETVDLLGLLIDAKEWQELDEVMAEIVELDYVSLFGGQAERLPRGEVIDRWKEQLTPLKATQHIITNAHMTVKPDGMAECAANVLATHVGANAMSDALWTLGGRYDFQLRLEGGRWRISAIKLTVLWSTGTPLVVNPAGSRPS